MILIWKQSKYQFYQLVKSINTNISLIKDILPSSQQQIIEQARFNYSPLRKAIEKQIKTVEDQGEKQVKALESLKPQEQTKVITHKSDDDNTAISKEIFDEILEEKMDEIKMIREINYNNLVYDFKG